MSFLSRVKRLFSRTKYINSEAGYDLWSINYDQQPGNLMLDLDEELFSALLKEIAIRDKVIVDVGCGTGRHWVKILLQKPAQLIGYDISTGMLDKLLQKYPGAETYVNEDCRLPELKDRSCDVIVSTLTIAHMKDVMGPFGEWNRVLKPQGRIILTDYHPALLAMGAQRTFRHEGKTIALVNYVHGIDRIREVAKQLGWEELRFRERVIDETMRVYYERQGALSVYEKFVETPVIYGICWEKT